VKLLIEEKPNSLLNFFLPAVAIALFIPLLTLGPLGAILVDLFFPILPLDEIMATIIINLFGQICVIVIILVLLLRSFKVEDSKQESLTPTRLLKTIPAFCLMFTLSMIVALLLTTFFSLMGLPIDDSYAALTPTVAQIANPLNILLFFGTLVFGAAIAEELFFRRLLIPLFENRGLGPLAAVVASSLGFALIHMPNDFINGTIAFAITHFVATFTTGFVLGASYVATRNVVFPMILHGLVNGVAGTAMIVLVLDDFFMIIMYGLFLFALIIIGIIVGIIAIWQYVRSKPARWALVLREKSEVKAFPGVIGYIFIALGLVVVPIIMELVIALVFFPDLLLIYIMFFAFYIAFVFFLLWLITQTRKPQVFSKPEPSPPAAEETM
jgi:membrane protease YdiL (CAAX protease family)